jgi:ribosome-binding protein aMBF1 (putative translation factor)
MKSVIEKHSKKPCSSKNHVSPSSRIRLRRRYLGWTVLDLARRASFDVFDIQVIEASDGNLSPQEAYVLGKILGLDPCTLVTPHRSMEEEMT